MKRSNLVFFLENKKWWKIQTMIRFFQNLTQTHPLTQNRIQCSQVSVTRNASTDLAWDYSAHEASPLLRGTAQSIYRFHFFKINTILIINYTSLLTETIGIKHFYKLNTNTKLFVS